MKKLTWVAALCVGSFVVGCAPEPPTKQLDNVPKPAIESSADHPATEEKASGEGKPDATTDEKPEIKTDLPPEEKPEGKPADEK